MGRRKYVVLYSIVGASGAKLTRPRVSRDLGWAAAVAGVRRQSLAPAEAAVVLRRLASGSPNAVAYHAAMVRNYVVAYNGGERVARLHTHFTRPRPQMYGGLGNCGRGRQTPISGATAEQEKCPAT